MKARRRGEIIQNFSQILVGLDRFNRIISVSLTVLILNGHIMAALEITTWKFPPAPPPSLSHSPFPSS